MATRLVKLPFKLPRAQARLVNQGLKRVAPLNPPPVPGGERHAWLVLRDETPVGYLSVRAEGETAELTANFWDGVSGPKLLPRWIERELSHYSFYTARVWASNQRVKRLLQRAGFALLGKGPGGSKAIELYGVTRAHFLALWSGNSPVESDEKAVQKEAA